METAIACWTAYARTISGGAVHRLRGVDVAVFTDGPERDVFNNAVLAPQRIPSRRRVALDRMVSTYADAGVAAYAAWVHENDTGMLEELADLDFVHQETTWAMGRELDGVPAPTEHEVVPGAWADYLRVLELPPGLLTDADPDDFHVVVGHWGGAVVAAGMAFDHNGDCGIYNVGTLPSARRLGLGSAVVARLLRDAFDRGCQTATLQATELARGVYAAQGFHELGRILEHGPPNRRAVPSGTSGAGPR
jgi:GNAT superfamily N-acetyltransferase